MVNAKRPEQAGRRGQEVRRLALDREDRPPAGLGALLRLPRPAAQSAAAAAEPLEDRPGRKRSTFLNQYGKIMPPQWTAAMGTILNDALANIVKNGADATAEVAARRPAVPGRADQGALAGRRRSTVAGRIPSIPASPFSRFAEKGGTPPRRGTPPGAKAPSPTWERGSGVRAVEAS